MQKINDKLTYRLIQLFVVVSGSIFLLLLDHAYRTSLARESDRKLAEAASTMERRLSVKFNRLTLVSGDLSAFLMSQPEPIAPGAFAKFSEALHNHYPELDALVYVGPDRIIREISPLEGNERAIGLDLSKRPAAPYIEKAISERRLIVDPPHIMSNGKLALISRIPIYRGDKLLGLAQVVFPVKDVIQSILAEFGNQFTIQLRDENGKLFWGNDHLRVGKYTRDLVVAGNVWTLSVAPAKAPDAFDLILAFIWGIGGFALLLTIISIRSEYRLRHALKAEVKKTTRELFMRNEELELQIRHRQEAEANVRRSEKSLCEAQQIAHVGNWVRDIADDRLYWSDELYRIFGFEPQEFEPTFESFLSRVHPNDRDTIRQGLISAQKFNAPFEPEFRIDLPDGRTRYLRASGIVECDAEGNPQRTAGTVQDITAQKLSVKALEESERKYRAVLEHASDGIIIASAEGKVLDVNRRIQTLLGYSRAELCGMHVSEIHPPEVAEEHRNAFANVRELGAGVTERLVLRKDGTTLPVEISGAFITFESQQIALGIFRDISERKRIDEELQQYRNHLEQLVEQRTAELVALNNELEAFSYSVSHDLRAPLRAIRGFSMALKENFCVEMDSKGHDYLDRILSAAGRMGRLIDDLLRLSSVIRSDMHWEDVSLSAVAMDLLRELNAADPGHHVRFVSAEEVNAKGDPILIHTLMQNLLNNAWKFTRAKDDPVIEFSVTSRDGKPVYFVRDNGIGFEAEHASELFKPFYRLHGTDDYEGNGIGLASVQRIVHRHRGQVWAESEPGQGATFYFTLGAE